LPGALPYASPAVRVFARELGVDLARIKGSERGGRIGKQDVREHVKAMLSGAATARVGGGEGGLQLIPWPQVDFSKFGEIELQPRSRINKISGANLARNWAMIPHVTQFEEADITEMEAFRRKLGEEHKDIKITPLVFLIKAAVAALKKYPAFNASLDGDNLVLKKYFHIGIAVDTPDGLMVPVSCRPSWPRSAARRAKRSSARSTCRVAAFPFLRSVALAEPHLLRSSTRPKSPSSVFLSRR
jgi:pyruvate dehydrogenase E2 component (dihydrolipoamide acetyltransferase)